MDIAFWNSSLTQNSATTEENFICYVFPSESHHATNLLSNETFFWDPKSNQYIVKYKQVLL